MMKSFMSVLNLTDNMCMYNLLIHFFTSICFSHNFCQSSGYKIITHKGLIYILMFTERVEHLLSWLRLLLFQPVFFLLWLMIRSYKKLWLCVFFYLKLYLQGSTPPYLGINELFCLYSLMLWAEWMQLGIHLITKHLSLNYLRTWLFELIETIQLSTNYLNIFWRKNWVQF